jgi:hypothetical protein
MGFIAPVLGAVGSLVGAIGAMSSANNQAAALEAQAKERERVAAQERANAQRVAVEKQREEKLIQSTLQARAAASGGGAQDPTVVRLASGIAQEGNYQTRGAIYEGESKAAVLEGQAAIDRMEARSARTAGMFSAFGSVIGGLSSFANSWSQMSSGGTTSSSGRKGYYY